MAIPIKIIGTGPGHAGAWAGERVKKSNNFTQRREGAKTGKERPLSSRCALSDFAPWREMLLHSAHFSDHAPVLVDSLRWAPVMSGHLWSRWLESDVSRSAACFRQWSRADWNLRWYYRPMRIPTARIRELRASPTEAEKARK